MNSERRGHRLTRQWWVAAALLVAVGWLVTPGAVTVYDGVARPDEPYRYVSTPPGTKVTAKKPAVVRAVLPIAAGVNVQDETLLSVESGPQVSVFLPQGGLAASAGTVSATLVPQAPTDQPANARIDGNVYRLSITGRAGPVTFTSGPINATIYLRATTARQPPPVIEHRAGPGEKWQPLTTSRMGNDVYLALLKGSGEYAVAFLGTPPGGAYSAGTGGSHNGLVVGLVALLVVLLSVILAVRWRAPKVP